MPDTQRNALAELAKQLGMFADFNRDADRVNGYVITKAKRIVAELAKVNCGHWKPLKNGHCPYFCYATDSRIECMVCKCRAIAEEGAGDGK